MKTNVFFRIGDDVILLAKLVDKSIGLSDEGAILPKASMIRKNQTWFRATFSVPNQSVIKGSQNGLSCIQLRR